jgi:cation transport ATPase
MTESSTHRRAARSYAREFGAAMAAYALTVLGTSLWLDAHPEAPLRLAVALLPVIPVVFVVIAAVRFYRRQDELLQRRQVEALAFAFVATALVVITYGFLETVGFPRLSAWWTWSTMAVLWCIGSFVSSRRYG